MEFPWVSLRQPASLLTCTNWQLRVGPWRMANGANIRTGIGSSGKRETHSVNKPCLFSNTCLSPWEVFSLSNRERDFLPLPQSHSYTLRTVLTTNTMLPTGVRFKQKQRVHRFLLWSSLPPLRRSSTTDKYIYAFQVIYIITETQ